MALFTPAILVKSFGVAYLPFALHTVVRLTAYRPFRTASVQHHIGDASMRGGEGNADGWLVPASVVSGHCPRSVSFLAYAVLP